MSNIDETISFIKSKINSFKPEIAIVLGSGLGALPDEFDGIKIPYAEIPYFQQSKVVGHNNQLCFCSINGKNVVFMQGRFHYYEGYSMQEITYPIKVFKKLGVKKVVLTNAAGSAKKSLKVGDLMLITDHINFMGNNPLIGQNDETLGTRFPDMSEIYNKNIINKVEKIGKSIGVKLKKGVYMAMSGPSYETPAEVKIATKLGASAIGMSTAPEAIVANYCGMKVLGISCITNYGAGICKKKLDHNEVMETTNNVNEKFKKLITNIIGIL